MTPDVELFARPAIVWAGASSPVRARNIADIPHPGRIEDGEKTPYGAGPAIEGGAGLRVSGTPYALSVGALVGYRRVSGSDAEPSTGYFGFKRSAWWAGAYGRVGFPPLGSFEPFVSGGLAYMHDSQYYATSASSFGIGQANLAHDGLAIPLSAGALLRLSRVFAIGPYLSITPVLPLGASYVLRSSGPEVSADVSGLVYVALAAGIELRVRFGGDPN
jgi:hypothetical protein